MKELKLIGITSEKRRVYQIPKLVIQGRKIEVLIIDPHFEKKHGDNINDELIYKFALKLEGRKVIIEDRKKPYEYFTFWPLFCEWRAYKLVCCLEDEKSYLGIIDCYRISKYDKKKK